MQSYIISFLLFLLPLVVLPFGTSYFEIPKAILTEFGIQILAIITLFKSKTLSLSKTNIKKLTPFILIVLLSAVHLIFFRTQTAFFGNIYRLQGILLLWHLLAFALISADFNIKRFPRILPLISLLLLFITSLSLGSNENGRAFGTLGEPNALAATAIFIWPFIYFNPNLQTRLGGLKLGIIALLISSIIIFLSGSRSGLTAFIIQVSFIFINRFLRLSFAKSTIICLILITLSLALPFLEKEKIFENRFEVWQTALVAGFKSPIIGSGFGNIEETLKQTSIKINNNIQYQYVDSSHNFILDWWVQAGVLGIIPIFYLLFISFRNFIQNSKMLEIVLFLGILTSMLFNPVSVVILIYFWWLVGQGYAKN